jgi:hypothetical protein
MRLYYEYRKVVSDIEQPTLIQVLIGAKNNARPIISEIAGSGARRVVVKVRGATTV